MVKLVRRYIFVDYETLIQIKFRKIEKICDKLFVFCKSDLTAIPLSLVKDMQRMGSAVKWVDVESLSESDLNYHVCFLMGKLHEKISSDIEFAILANDPSFDPLVHFINSTGRSCIRVKPLPEATVPTTPEKPAETVLEDLPTTTAKDNSSDTALEASSEALSARLFSATDAAAEALGESVSDETVIEETAKETVRRLMRSGNRPLDLPMLRNYILLHNQALSVHSNVDKIIEKLKDLNNINVNNSQVTYNF